MKRKLPALVPAAVAALLAAPWVGNLTSIELADNGLTVTGLRSLAAAPVPELDALNLSRNPLGEHGAEHLAKAEFFPRLRRLVLSRCDLGPVGAEVLFAGRLGSLIDLDVGFNGLGPDGAAAELVGDALAVELVVPEVGPAAVTPAEVAGSPVDVVKPGPAEPEAM